MVTHLFLRAPSKADYGTTCDPDEHEFKRELITVRDCAAFHHNDRRKVTNENVGDQPGHQSHQEGKDIQL